MGGHTRTLVVDGPDGPRLVVVYDNPGDGRRHADGQADEDRRDGGDDRAEDRHELGESCQQA